MKIAQVVCVFPPYRGGIGNAAYQFSKMLSQKGHSVTVFTPKYKKNGLFLEDGFKTRGLKPFLKYGNAAFIPQLLFCLNKFDIVYFHYPFFGASEMVWLLAIFAGAKFKLIIHYHMDVIDLNPFVNLLTFPSRAFLPFLVKRATFVSCASIDYIKNSDIKKIYIKNKEKFFEVPFAVDTNKFNVLSAGGKKGEYIMFVGSLDRAHNFKGLDILLRAVKDISDKKINLLIVGDGDLRTEYEKLSEQLRISSRVQFLGNVSDGDLPEIYKRASALILPSINRHEAFGLVILEALASGVPVIASDLPGVRSVFGNKVEGLLFNPGDVNDLVKKINMLLSDDNMRNVMGQKGRLLAENKYSLTTMADKLNSLINNTF